MDNRNLNNIYLAGRFRFDPLTLFSFSGALHSVLTSPFADMEYSGVRLRTACWAECKPSAGFRPFRKSSSTQCLGISTHIPVLSRSNGGVSSCTESRMALLLPSQKQVSSFCPAKKEKLCQPDLVKSKYHSDDFDLSEVGEHGRTPYFAYTVGVRRIDVAIGTDGIGLVS